MQEDTYGWYEMSWIPCKALQRSVWRKAVTLWVPCLCHQAGLLQSTCSYGSELLTVMILHVCDFLPISLSLTRSLPRPRTSSPLSLQHPVKVICYGFMKGTFMLSERCTVELGRLPEWISTSPWMENGSCFPRNGDIQEPCSQNPLFL